MSNSVKSFKPKNIVITALANDAKEGNRVDLTALCPLFDYYENIDNPFIVASLTVIDGTNLIGTLPIQGGEKVEIEFECGFGENGSVKQESVKYSFRVWKVYKREFTTRAQMYNLALTSDEAFVNEYQKVVKQLSGKPSEIVEDLLKNYLKTKKDLDIEDTGNQVNYYPARRSVVSIITKMQVKSLSQKAFDNSKKKPVQTSNSKVSNENSENDAALKGTAGYLFFENRKGFVFKSMDKICDVGKNFGGSAPIAEYKVQVVSDSGNPEFYYNIDSYRFTEEIDIMRKFRLGVYSTKMVFYNISSGKYEEFTYTLEDSFENMAKLGNQDKLPSFVTGFDGQKLPPTRVMSMAIDHETWHGGEKPADPEQKGGGTDFPDDAKYTIAQGSARRYTLDLLKMEISVPGNAALTVGEKVKIYLPNMRTGTDRKKNPWDRESSGNYLISKIHHSFAMADETGAKFTTEMELIRDTYGMDEDPSKVT
jgi:hypothetical protein